MTILNFPNDFVWGVAASAYQIEGAYKEDGRGTSIWDTFSHTPGKIRNNDNGDVAADHYHRCIEDIALMSEIGIKAYRFSTAWPRILPAGTGKVNQKGLEFYDRLVDELLRRKIEPYVCLFHWDMPQPLQDKGGWPNRDTSAHFAEYARVVAGCLGDRVKFWFTQNEPWVLAFIGHFLGTHAPGKKDIGATIKSLHHLLLAHGLATDAIRSAVKQPVKIGITLNLHPVYPATDSEKDRAAAERVDMFINRIVLDPLLKGSSPLQESPLTRLLAAHVIRDGDLEKIRQLDLLGVNYYTRAVMRHSNKVPVLNVEQVQPVGNEYSGMWEIYPEGMYQVLKTVWEYLRPSASPSPRTPLPSTGEGNKVELMVTENGIPVPDGVDFDGRVRDERRIRYLRDHLAQVHRAIEDGIPVNGYFHWSLLDNFEWELGYSQRFGLVYVDFKTQKRIMKDSGRWFAKVIEENALPSHLRFREEIASPAVAGSQ